MAEAKRKKWYRWLKRAVLGPARRQVNAYKRPVKTVKVGINYPWGDYGCDFGAVPASRTRAAWKRNIARDLGNLKRYGVFAVRWFILADGLAYGSGTDAPQKTTTSSGDVWTFSAPQQFDVTAIKNDFKSLVSG